MYRVDQGRVDRLADGRDDICDRCGNVVPTDTPFCRYTRDDDGEQVFVCDACTTDTERANGS